MANPKRMLAAIQLLNNRLFEERYLDKLNTCLRKRWDKYHSLSAAMKLMEEHGVRLSSEEEERLGEMDERQMIEALVAKMPSQSKGDFQSFFLKLQIIVNSATRIRQGLEASRTDLVEKALNDAESAGMSGYILKMAVVTAANEVSQLKYQHEAWVKESQAQAGKQLRGQEECMKARKKLATVQNQLMVQSGKVKAHMMKALMTFTKGSGPAMLASILKGWRSYTQTQKEEREIYEEFREHIERVEQKLVELKTSQMRGVRGIMSKKGDAKERELLLEVFAIWQEDLEQVKFDRLNATSIADLEAKLGELEGQQSGKVQKVMMKMLGESNMACVKLVWQGFLKFHKDYQKDRALEDQVKAVEGSVKAFMKSKSASNQAVMAKMAGATDAGLVHSTFGAWRHVVIETKMENEMAEELAKAQSKFSTFGGRNKRGATSALDRARMVQEHQFLTMILLKWRLDSHHDFIHRDGLSRLEGKRAQLQKVQSMFRDFAQKLENNIKPGQDSEREIARGPPLRRPLRKQMQRKEEGGGSVSLPDIHSPQKPPRPSRREVDEMSGSGRRW
mmetsp:Transcript_120156/g.340094  ORF Transcript_120156/g.340094 Transcript_120156/m.340094 type:complete len:562 (-) Transcript_120156:139-1824(-)